MTPGFKSPNQPTLFERPVPPAGSARFADDEFEPEIAFTFTDHLTLQQFNRGECGLFALRYSLRGHCRESRRNVGRNRQVVEPRNSNIAGNRKSGVTQS